ncbi:MAG: hypothetical protein QM607_07785 [Microbacterium sp.]
MNTTAHRIRPGRIWLVVLGQPDDDARFSSSRELYAQLEKQLAK